jgi:Cft2 family RNA processing exonuclease
MEIQFLGGATTVTGSQFLLVTERARVLIDCGMFQGSPNEAVRNRVPLAYDPSGIDAILLTHAHLDHCGLIPHVVDAGFHGPIIATRGTCELAELVLLDSGRLQEEFAKREARWERKHPDEVAADDAKERAAYEAAVHLSEHPETPVELGTGRGPADEEEGRTPAPDAATIASPSVSEEAAEAIRPTSVSAAPASLAAEPGAPLSAEPASAEHVSAEAGSAANAATPGSVSSSSSWTPVEPTENAEDVLRSQPPELQIDLDEPLYTERQAKAAITQFRPVEYDEELEIAPGIHARYLDAGHILGSAIIRVRVVERDGGPERTIVFSGDLGRPNTPIIRDPTVLTDADYVLVETTYGGREHEPGDEAIRVLAETVRMVAEARGVLLVPSFAIGRTQEVVWQLDRLIDRGEIPLLPLYLDSPMASKASDIYRRHADYFDAETGKLLREGGSPLDYPDQHETRLLPDSQAIATAPRPYMIIASNGMLTGGRVVGHLRNLISDPDATLLFVGYQGEGTLGAHLQAGVKVVKLDGKEREVRCRIRSISGFSAHADEHELLDWLSNFAKGKEPGSAGFPRRVFLVHGDPEAQIAIDPKVRALGFDTHIPHWRETVTLD